MAIYKIMIDNSPFFVLFNRARYFLQTKLLTSWNIWFFIQTRPSCLYLLFFR